MKCAKFHLQERVKTARRATRPDTPDKPRRYCQKRMVNPEHEEDPRWMDVLQRFHCNASENVNETFISAGPQEEFEDLFLSVQNLKFQGDEQHRKRPRTSFKYKTLTDSQRHRMFVKQQVAYDPDYTDEDRSSQLTCYYFDDYANYLLNNDRSRPSSGKSTIFLQDLKNKVIEKATQVEINKNVNTKKIHNVECKAKTNLDIQQVIDDNKDQKYETAVQDTKIAFHKSGKRKSLTISRAPSPETVQVIRVDVVCNYSSSSTLSDYETNKKQSKTNTEKIEDQLNNVKNTHFANKYLLTNTVKSLEERVAGGAKVTLLCKTFRLTERSKQSTKTKLVNSVKSKIKK